MKVKEEFLDLVVSCPFTGKHLWLRDVETGMYKYLYNAGYEYLFEVKEIKKGK